MSKPTAFFKEPESIDIIDLPAAEVAAAIKANARAATEIFGRLCEEAIYGLNMKIELSQNPCLMRRLETFLAVCKAGRTRKTKHDHKAPEPAPKKFTITLTEEQADELMYIFGEARERADEDLTFACEEKDRTYAEVTAEDLAGVQKTRDDIQLLWIEAQKQIDSQR
jgi:hypothetical protein